MSNQKSVKKRGKELTFIQKCIIMANIFQDQNKHVINSFNNIPYVKLYSSNIEDEKFVYSKIKGALMLIHEEDKDNSNFFLQIYDINNYSMEFNFQINQILLDKKIVDEKFIGIPTKNYCIGFKFSSDDSMKNFLLSLKCEKPNYDINERVKEFECENSEIQKIIKSIKENLDKKLKNIYKENLSIEQEKSSFQKLEELYYLTNNIEYSELNDKLNIFVDQNINPFAIKLYIDSYKNKIDKNSFPYKIVFNDYNKISNKKNYVDILVNNLINNFEEEKNLISLQKQHKKKNAKEDISKNNMNFRSSAMIRNPNFNIDEKNNFQNNME
jgi:hypothetical protein